LTFVCYLFCIVVENGQFVIGGGVVGMDFTQSLESKTVIFCDHEQLKIFTSGCVNKKSFAKYCLFSSPVPASWFLREHLSKLHRIPAESLFGCSTMCHTEQLSIVFKRLVFSPSFELKGGIYIHLQLYLNTFVAPLHSSW
jgi:hypothetical protein